MATEWPLVSWALLIALETMIIAGLPSPRRFNLSARPTKLLMVPLVLGAIPWMVYAVAMWDLNRQDRPDADITVGIDHYSVQGAYGLALLGLATLAALCPAARVARAFAAAAARGETQPLADPTETVACLLGPLHYRILIQGAPVTDAFLDRLIAAAAPEPATATTS